MEYALWTMMAYAHRMLSWMGRYAKCRFIQCAAYNLCQHRRQHERWMDGCSIHFDQFNVIKCWRIESFPSIQFTRCISRCSMWCMQYANPIEVKWLSGFQNVWQEINMLFHRVHFLCVPNSWCLHSNGRWSHEWIQWIWMNAKNNAFKL